MRKAHKNDMKMTCKISYCVKGFCCTRHSCAPPHYITAHKLAHTYPHPKMMRGLRRVLRFGHSSGEMLPASILQLGRFTCNAGEILATAIKARCSGCSYFLIASWSESACVKLIIGNILRRQKRLQCSWSSSEAPTGCRRGTKTVES